MGLTVTEALGIAIKRSDYRALLARACTAVGFVVDDEAVILRSDPETMRMRFEPCPSLREAKVQCWGVVDRRKLMTLDDRTSLPIDVRPAGPNAVPSKLARILTRTFQAPGTFEAPVGERRDLVYATMFGDQVEVLLRSTSGTLEVLRYRDAIRGHDVVVTSGVSNPERAPTGFFKELDARTVGAGYELMVLCDPGDARLSDQLCAMVRQSVSQGAHLLPGEWIWLEGDCLPDSDIGGFLIATPKTFPDRIPVSAGVAYFTLLIPTTRDEVQYARTKGVFEVATMLAENGVRDASPMRRASVPGVPQWVPEAKTTGHPILDAIGDDPFTQYSTALHKVLTSASQFVALLELAPAVVFVIGDCAVDFNVHPSRERIAFRIHEPNEADARFRVIIEPWALKSAAYGGGAVPVKVEMPQNAGRDATRVARVLASCFAGN